MRDFLIKLSKIERRYIYLALFLALTLPLIFPPNFPQKMSPTVKSVFEFIDTLPPGSHVLLSADYDASVLPEVMTLYPQGAVLALDAFKEAEEYLGARRDTDYVFLGYQAGFQAVILGIGENIKNVFPKDYFGTPIDSIPAMRGVNNYKDIALVISC